MSAQKGLAQRRTGEWKLLQARVRPDLDADVKEAAKASGVSFSLYVEMVLERARDEAGQMPVIPVSNYKQEELPIPTE